MRARSTVAGALNLALAFLASAGCSDSPSSPRGAANDAGSFDAEPTLDARPSRDAEVAGEGGDDAGADVSPPDAAPPTIDAATDAAPPRPRDPLLADPICTSGKLRWINEQEGPEMAPGRACIQCHADSNAASGEGDAPLFAFAGTLYPTGHEPDFCIAETLQGAVVEVTDGAGEVHVVPVNESGNFFFEDPAPPPFNAVVRIGDRTRRMVGAQSSGDCNGCHTPGGLNDAPGRITAPR